MSKPGVRICNSYNIYIMLPELLSNINTIYIPGHNPYDMSVFMENKSAASVNQ